MKRPRALGVLYKENRVSDLFRGRGRKIPDRQMQAMHLELGKPGSLNSAGTMPLISLSIGIEVAGAFLLIWTEFLDQTLLVRSGGGEE